MLYHIFRMNYYCLKKIALILLFFFKVSDLTSTLPMGNTLERSDMLPEEENSTSSRLKNNSSIEPEQPTLALKMFLVSAVVWKEIIRQIQYFSLFISLFLFLEHNFVT